MMSAEVKIPSREIKLKSSTLKVSNPSVHLLPCRVECDGVRDEVGEGCGPAKVDTYFAPVIRESNERIRLSTTASKDEELSPVYSATFRGRRLKGVKVNTPNGFVGCILKETNPSHGDEAREFEVCGQFQELSYWNLQTTPTADDKLFQALTWTRLAQSLHSPLPIKGPDTTAPMDT